tara:strand:+ start:605 stop:865 length:261 start_codon:yes stop_codon:yes gene_type:complete
MTTYRLRLSQTKEFDVENDNHLLQEICSVLMCRGLEMPLMLKSIANACCDWNGEVYRYGNKDELIADMIKNKVLVNMNERKANEEN